MNRIALPKSSSHQREVMLQFMEKYPEIGNEKLATQYDLSYKKNKWIELTKILNSLPGRLKTPEKWQKAWQDWRYQTRKKIDKDPNYVPTRNEQRILNISTYDLTFPDFYQPPEVNNRFRENILGYPAEIEIVKPEPIEYFQTRVKQEPGEFPANPADSENNFQLFETSVQSQPELSLENSSTSSSLSSATTQKQNRQNRRFIYTAGCNHNELLKVTKYVYKSTRTIAKMSRLQTKTTAKILRTLEENSRSLQSLTDYQARQTEALEKQIKLSETRNSILKKFVATLSTIKKFS